MTGNQLRYWELQETKRHNVTGEGETNRHNVVTESETNRHNVATENIDISKLGETMRHNKVTEGQTDRDLGEKYRHNLVTESETGRHNKATEGIDLGKLGESIRHNQASESIEGRKNDLSQSSILETGRHNQATEELTAQKQEYENNLNDVRREYTQAQLDNRLPYAEMKKIEAQINNLATQDWATMSEQKRRDVQFKVNSLLELLKQF